GARVRAVAAGSGGRVPQLRGQVLDDEGGDQVGEDPASGQVWILGWEPIDVQQALQPLEGQLDAPSQPIEGAELLGAGALWVERGDQHQVASRSKAQGVVLVPAA